MFCQPLVVLLIVVDFLHNALAYGCMAFFTSSLDGRGFSAFEYQVIILPYPTR